MSMSLRLVVLLLGLVVVAAAQPITLTVTPAPPARNLYRWQLLPGLLVQKSGDAVEFYHKAHAAILEVEPVSRDRGQLSLEIDRLRSEPVEKVDRKRVAEIVTRYAKPLELIHQAARCDHADWDFVTERLRKNGVAALLEEIQHVREFMEFLHLEARHHLLEDRPDRAIEVVAASMSLARQLSDCPTLISHLVALAISQLSLNMLQDCLQHPRCPGLFGPLTDLPHPLIPVRRGYEGERVMIYGTIPGLEKLATDPLANLDARALETVLGFYREIQRERPVNRPDVPALDRFLLATAMKEKHPAALKALASAGYDQATLAKIPILNAALLHAVLEYEEGLGAMASAAGLPVHQAREQLDRLAAKYPRRPRTKPLPDEAAFPLAAYLLPTAEKIAASDVRLLRRIEVLRLAELLREHAARTGKWPDKLDEVRSVPLLVDPGTGKPFEYRRETDTAVILAPPVRKDDPTNHDLTLRLTLRKTEEKTP